MKRILALAAVVLFSFLAGHRMLVSGDDGTYIALSRSIADGDYRAINVPGAPVQSQYPPLFPILLAPFASLPSSAFGALRLWMAIWSLLAVVPLALAARRRDPALGVAALLPVVVSPWFGHFGTSVLTEVLFLLLAYAVIMRLDAFTRRTVHEQGSSGPIAGSRSWAIDPFIPLGVAAAWLTKSLGVAVAAAVLLHLLSQRRFRSAVTTAVVIVLAMAPWWAWQSAHAGDYVRGHILQRDIYDPSAGGLSTAQLLLERLPHNASRYAARILPELVLPPFAGFLTHAGWTLWAKAALGLALTLAALAGLLRRVRRDGWSAEEWYVACALAVLLAHPVYADRYLFLLLPSIAGYLLLAVPGLAARRRVAAAWGAVLVVGSVTVLTAPTPREDLAFHEAVDWIKEHTPDTAIIYSRKPTAVWYYANRMGTGYPPTTETSAWIGGDYVIRDDYVIGIHAARRYIDPVVADTVLFTHAWTSAILPSVRIHARAAAR